MKPARRLSCTSSARVTEQTGGDVAAAAYFTLRPRNVGHVVSERTSSPIKDGCSERLSANFRMVTS